MKKAVLVIIALMTIVIVQAQTTQNPSVDYEQQINALVQRIDSLTKEQNELLEKIEWDLSMKDRYKLYPTQNMYNFLLLDTQTGRVQQVQWSLESSKEFSVYINGDNLNYSYDEGRPGTFELYPTQNMYQFLLIDKVHGRKWHIQWGLESGKRWIRYFY